MGNLLAGAAMRVITPPPELLARLATSRENYKGVHQDTYVRVIALSDGTRKIALFGCDMGVFPNCRMTEQAVKERFGTEDLGCIFSATHCHEMPWAIYTEEEGGDKLFSNFGLEPEARREFAKYVLDKTLEAAEDAFASLRPARMGVARGESFINCNRDLPTPLGGVQSNNFKGTQDHELLVIKFEELESHEPIAVWINHATHSNYMCWNLYNGNYEMINGDVGGGVAEFVEKAMKCGRRAPVIWAIGAAGDQNPITRSSWRVIRVDDDGNYSMKQEYFEYRDNLLQLENLVGTQGLEVMELLDSMNEWTEEFCFRSADTHRSIPARKSYNELKIHPMCGERPDPIPNTEVGTVDFYFRVSNVCGVSFVNLIGEPYAGLGLLVKKMMPTEYTSINEATFGHQGYVPDVSMEWVNGFGTMGTHCWSAEKTEEAYKDAMDKLVSKVYGK